MVRMLLILFMMFMPLVSLNVWADNQKTERFPQIKNDKVSVWKTIIYPTKHHQLSMHRHEHARIVVALTDGILKVTNKKGQSHNLILQKDHAYYLTADSPGEFHTDENRGVKAIKVMVIELH